MRYSDDFYKISDLVKAISDGEIKDLPSIVEIFINTAYNYNVRPFIPYINVAFFEELKRQASYEEIIMMYLDLRDSNDLPLLQLASTIKHCPAYRADIFLAQKYYNKVDLEAFCDADGQLFTIMLVEAYMAAKETFMFDYWEEYMAMMPASEPVEEVVVYGV